MLYVRPDLGKRRRPDLHGLASQLLDELSESELSLLHGMLTSGGRPVAKDYVEERGFPRSVLSCIFWKEND